MATSTIAREPAPSSPLLRITRPNGSRGAIRDNTELQPSREGAHLTRIFDLVVAVGALIVSAPAILVVALLVRLSSPGPVVHVATRAGLSGRPFGMLKFRTMRVGAEQGPSVTTGADSRITPIGRYLRLTKLDELPQLVNVVRGEMSIVGPRPEAVSIVERFYTREDRELLSVRPGIACPGQIFYYLEQADQEPPAGIEPELFYAQKQLPIKLAYDAYWLKRRTLWLDIRVLVDTCRAMLCRMTGTQCRWDWSMDPGYDLSPREPKRHSQSGVGRER